MKMTAHIDKGSRVTHTWTIRPSPSSPEALHDLSVILGDFCIAVERGAFATGSDLPRCQHELHEEKNALEVRMMLDGTDVRYARVLRNTLFAFEQVNEIELSVVATQLPTANSTLVLEVDELEVEKGTFYPALSAGFPFPIDTVDTNRADRNRRMLLEFAAPIDVANENVLIELVGYWTRLVEFGYAPSEEALREGGYGVFDVQGGLFDQQSFDVTVATFITLETAWNSLLNLMANVPGARCLRAVIE